MRASETSIQGTDHLADPDYTYVFEDLVDKLKAGKVQVFKHHSRRSTLKQYSMRVAVEDEQLLKRRLVYMPPVIADCVDVAAAVFVADKLTGRSVSKRTHIHTVVPVRCPGLWNRNGLITELERILYWFTRDNWTFEFVRRLADPRPSEMQPRLPMQSDEDMHERVDGDCGVEVALWSGGLDAYAGLCNRVQDYPQRSFILFGTGSNDKTQHLQEQLATKLNGILDVRAISHRKARNTTQLKLVQVPVRLAHGENLPVRKIHRSSGQRSRGFVFMLLGAAYAYLENQRDLYLYENGPGAFNLPYRASETVRDHAVPVHPLSLLRMGRFFSMIIGEPFRFHNPFLLWTKAEMCETIAELPLRQLIWETMSCDRPRREIPSQCGCCSSCLLRRQALLALRLEDRTQYGVLSEMRDIENAKLLPLGNHRRPFKASHLQAMQYQVDRLKAIFQSDNPWFSLASRPGYALLEQTVEETAREVEAGIGSIPVTPKQILRLYQKYISEWTTDVEVALGYGLLPSTTLLGIGENVDIGSRNNKSRKPNDLHNTTQSNRVIVNDPRAYRQMDIDEFLERSGHAT
jgi:7-cyano-7-deazaguanine synthase in queuosine biosynthesis